MYRGENNRTRSPLLGSPSYVSWRTDVNTRRKIFLPFFLNLDKVHLQENSLTFDNNSATPLRRS